MFEQPLWELYHRQLAALEGSLELWASRRWSCVHNLEAHLAGVLALRIAADVEHTEGSLRLLEHPEPDPPGEVLALLRRVLLLVLDASEATALRGPPAGNWREVQEALGRVKKALNQEPDGNALV